MRNALDRLGDDQRVALEIIETVTSDPEAPMRMVLANNTEELFP